MKNQYFLKSFTFSIVFFILVQSSFAQVKNLFFAESFHRGSLLIGISEGSTKSRFTTKNYATNSDNPVLVKHGDENGTRDPFFIEYGITNHWGLGISSGNDIFSVNANDYYGFKLSSNEPLKVKTNDFAFSTSYHVFCNRRLDLSVFTDLGFYDVQFSGQDQDSNPFQYKATGNIIRVGSRVRYYFFRHLGAFGMISSFAGHASPKNVSDNTIASTYITNVSGCSIEAGFCYRFFK